MEIGVKLSRTVNLGNYNSTKIDLELTDIDPNADIATQIEQGVTALRTVFNTLLDESVVASKKAVQAAQ